MRLGFDSSIVEKRWLVIILVAGLINGLLHVFLVPPWQHYDEPGHFEYAWLIANKPGLPESGEYIQSMRREVAASMIEHGFFAEMGFRSNLLSITEPIWIGISQTDDVPFYYTLVAAPLYIFGYTDITFQLYLGRIVSVGLFLMTLFGAYAITSELTKPGNSLRRLVPATVALIPAFVDIMSAVNNDAGAAAFFTLFLWVSVRMMQRGISWLNFGSLILLLAACVLTKSTTVFGIPLVIFAIVYSLVPEKYRIFIWVSISTAGIVLIFFLVSYDGAAFWHIQTIDPSIKQVQLDNAPLGDHVFQLDTPVREVPPSANQLIPSESIQPLIGSSVTVGSWIWGSEPAEALTPILDDGVDRTFSAVSVGVNPQFFTYSTKLGHETDRIIIWLETIRQPGDKKVKIYYDGLVLIDGDYTNQVQPIYDDASGDYGEWRGADFMNHIRNASFEKAAPRIRSGIESLLDPYLPARVSLIISSIIDVENYRNYYVSAAQHLFRSFWAVFGWGQVYLIGSRPYRVLLFFTLFGLLGDAVVLWKYRRGLDFHLLAFLGLALVGVWATTLTRGVSTIFSNLFIPASRYAYPVIVPTVLLITVGWREILRSIGKRVHISTGYLYGVYIGLLIMLNLISLYSIMGFFGSV